MSNASRRRRSFSSVAPSPASSCSSSPFASQELLASSSQPPPHWRFSQAVGAGGGDDGGGARAPQDDADTVSAIEFDGRGDYLAAGDHAGRVILFRSTDEIHHHPRPRAELERADHAAAAAPAAAAPRYSYMTEFQSHEPEFDVLHSLEIGEKIKRLSWCAPPNSSLFMLSTNDRTIKLWKLRGRSERARRRVGVGGALRLRRCPRSLCSGRTSVRARRLGAVPLLVILLNILKRRVMSGMITLRNAGESSRVLTSSTSTPSRTTATGRRSCRRTTSG